MLGTVGEPINPEAWMWYHAHIGGERCPIVDTWWQTETGGHMITPLPGVITTKPGSATLPAARHRRRGGRRRRATRSSRGGGYLTLTTAVAVDAAGHLGRPASATATPTGRSYQGRYFAGDGAKIDDDGYLWLLGRVDDVMNVSGHRISTTEVESALVDHPAVAEAAVVGATDDDDRPGDHRLRHPPRRTTTPSDELGEEIRQHVATKLGADRPAQDGRASCPTCPRPAVGKIMRRLLRDVAEGRDLGDTTTLADRRRGRGDPDPRRASRPRRTDGQPGALAAPRSISASTIRVDDSTTPASRFQPRSRRSSVATSAQAIRRR